MEALLRLHYDRVHAVCRRVTGSASDADDAAQEAMLAIVRGLPRFDGRSAFSTWVHRVATNASLDELRRRNRRPGPLRTVPGEGSSEGGIGREPKDETAERRVDGVADRLAIDEAIAQLPEEFRVAVVLRDVGDLDYGEIAAVLGVPVGTVKSRIARGRGLLVRSLSEPVAPDEDTGNQAPGGRRPTSGPPVPGPSGDAEAPTS
jgi:RNA polymerase sigma-70 factor (ECF subfamily)